MRKFYAMFLFGFIVKTGFTQPVLTQSNISPQIGESFTFSRINWDGTLPSPGANQTWDYSSIVEVTTATFDFVDPSTCPSASSFPTATVTAYTATGPQYEFNKINAAEWERVGFYASGVAIPYSDGEKILELPFTYNDTYVDNFGGTFVSGITWDREGDVTVTAIGYGTLILPNSTLSDVLCVKVVEDYGDFNADTGTEVYHYDIEIYMFYKPGIHQPVLGLTHYVQGSTEVYYGNFIDDPNLNVGDVSRNTISVYPNPAKEHLFINWAEPMQNDKKIEVYNVFGSLVYSSNQNENSISLAELSSGVYFVKLSEGDNSETIKFVVE